MKALLNCPYIELKCWYTFDLYFYKNVILVSNCYRG